MAATAEANSLAHASLIRSTIPLNKGGIRLMDSDRWQSEQQEHYRKYTVDVGANRRQADALKVFLTAPTASAGRLAAVHQCSIPAS
jgi:hypothetical protein